MSRSRLSDHQTTVRFLVIGMIVLAMLIPLAMVEGVTEERQSFFDMTLRDVANAWGNAQNLSGPFLVIPEEHRRQVKQKNGSLVWRTQTHNRVYLPSRLGMKAVVTHQFRKRSIYEVPVYLAQLRFEGVFPALDPENLNLTGVNVRLDQARIVVGVSHTQAISSASPLRLGAVEAPFRSGTGQAWIGSGVHVALERYEGNESQSFAFELQLKGTRQFGFTPVGGNTEVEMTSTWPHPSFDGNYLPESYEVREDGFTARWVVHELARNLPASWRVERREVQLEDSYAWISLFQPVTEYTIVDRAIKYGLLFIALTFLGFVCFELCTALLFHPVQYGVIGMGLVLFYLALLSLSEHLDFGLSYLIATTLLTVLISWYVRMMTGSNRLAGLMALIVAVLYSTLYVLLQLEAFALLVGTAVLFAGLMVLMATTRTLTQRAG